MYVLRHRFFQDRLRELFRTKSHQGPTFAFQTYVFLSPHSDGHYVSSGEKRGDGAGALSAEPAQSHFRQVTYPKRCISHQLYSCGAALVSGRGLAGRFGMWPEPGWIRCAAEACEHGRDSDEAGLCCVAWRHVPW